MAVLELHKRNPQERRERLEALLEEFGLVQVRKSRGDVLSGGEKRRTEIARALAARPPLYSARRAFRRCGPHRCGGHTADCQPTAHQGHRHPDHRPQRAGNLHITDRAYLLFEGHILKAGTAEELAADPQVRKVYLGQNFVLRSALEGGASAIEKEG